MTLKHCITATTALTLIASASANNLAQQAVQKITKNRVTIVKQFKSIANLTGFVIAPKGSVRKTVVYADNQGRYMVAGALVSPAGQNITQADYKKYVEDKQAPKIYAAAAKTHWVQQGSNKAPHSIYVVVEPNCIACHMLYQTVKPLIKSGQLSVRWIFVAFRKPSSEGMVAAILQAKDPGKALDENEKNFNEKTETGGIAPLKPIPAKLKTAIAANMTFMEKNGFMATPGVVYKTKSGEARVMHGFLPGKAFIKIIDNASNGQ
jgi:thiol:disulfide interchange protein DsbG